MLEHKIAFHEKITLLHCSQNCAWWYQNCVSQQIMIVVNSISQHYLADNHQTYHLLRNQLHFFTTVCIVASNNSRVWAHGKIKSQYIMLDHVPEPDCDLNLQIYLIDVITSDAVS